MAISHFVSEIFNVEKYGDLEIRVKRSLKVIESGTIWQIVYGFLLVVFIL